jgi:hypothetical protein
VLGPSLTFPHLTHAQIFTDLLVVEASGTAPESCLAFAPLQRYNIFILIPQYRNVNKLFRFPYGKRTISDRRPTNKVHWNDC